MINAALEHLRQASLEPQSGIAIQHGSATIRRDGDAVTVEMDL